MRVHLRRLGPDMKAARGIVTGTRREARLEGASPASQAAVAALQFVIASALNWRRTGREMRWR